MKKGFTLVELMAVIIILGVIALIAFPIIDNSIKKSKEDSLDQTIDNIELSAYNYSVQNVFDKPSIDEKKAIMLDRLQDTGFLEKEIINPVTDEEMEGCVWYYWDNNQYYFEYDQECVLEEATITITYDESLITNGWAKANMLVNIVSNGDSIKYCIDNSECEPNIEEKLPTYSVGVSKEGTNYICAVATNDLGTTEKVCESIKMDKTLPIISGIADIMVMRNDPVDLKTGITYEDALSGIDGSLVIEPNIVDTSTVGTKQVKYRVKDKAGNIREVVRNIIVDAEAPTITFALTNGTVNSNGWLNSNFYVRATIIDNSGTGIKTAASCTTNSTSECTPVGTFTGNIKDNYITTEGSNRICIQVTDNNNKTTKICSDTYKLDKTNPVISGTAMLTVMKGNSVNLSSGVSFTDALSGPDGTISISPSSIITTKAGTHTVTYQAKDKAGNIATVYRTVKVDANAPTISYKLLNSSDINSSGWADADFTVTATITDNSGTGISSMSSCQTNSTSSCTPNSTFTGTTKNFTISTNGSNRICIEATDNNGKTATICSGTYKLDKTTPSVTFTRTSGTLGSNSWYRSSVGVKATATVGSSGISSLKTCTTTGSTCTPTTSTTSTSYTRTLSTNSSSNKVCAQVTSVSGKKSDIKCSSSYKIDTVKPSCGTISGASTTWTAANRTITVGCSDSTSGCSSTSKTFTSTTTTSSITLYDNAGNSTSCSVNVYVDKDKPTVWADYQKYVDRGVVNTINKLYDVANGNALIINNGVLQSGNFSHRSSHYLQYFKKGMSPGFIAVGYSCTRSGGCSYQYRGCYRKGGQTYSRNWGSTGLGDGGGYYNYQYRVCNAVGTCADPIRVETWYNGNSGSDTCQVY